VVADNVFSVKLAVFPAQMLQVYSVQVSVNSFFYCEQFTAFRTHKLVSVNLDHCGVMPNCMFRFRVN
jgi:hypothetical protein